MLGAWLPIVLGVQDGDVPSCCGVCSRIRDCATEAVLLLLVDAIGVLAIDDEGCCAVDNAVEFNDECCSSRTVAGTAPSSSSAMVASRA
jgi:hypothetical protein